MRAPRRLLIGAAVLGLLVLACLVVPIVLKPVGKGDPVNAKLLPPGARVTVLTLEDGRTLVSPSIEHTTDGFLIRSPQRTTTILSTEVASQREARFWLGSDRFGRDILPRLLVGGRISLTIAGLGVSVALLVGLGVGLAAATGGRITDAVLMRLVDALLAFPLLLLLILVSALFRPGPGLLIAVLGLTSWMVQTYRLGSGDRANQGHDSAKSLVPGLIQMRQAVTCLFCLMVPTHSRISVRPRACQRW